MTKNNNSNCTSTTHLGCKYSTHPILVIQTKLTNGTDQQLQINAAGELRQKTVKDFGVDAVGEMIVSTD